MTRVLLAAVAAVATTAAARRMQQLPQLPQKAQPLPTLRVVAADNTLIQIEPFGANALRVRLRPDGNAIDPALPGALNATAGGPQGPAAWHGFRPQDVAVTGHTQVVNGNLGATVDEDTGLVTFSRVSDGVVVLRELGRNYTPAAAAAAAAIGGGGGASAFAAVDPSLPVLSISFNSSAQESILGFGEHQQGRLDNKGVAYDMESCLDYGKSHGGEVCLPFVLGATPGIPTAPAPDCAIQTPGLGCFQDSPQRLYPYEAGAVNQNNLTVELCAQECYRSNPAFGFAAVESGTQCYCGSVSPDPSRKLDADMCTSPCSGDAQETCGGPWTADVFAFNCTPSSPSSEVAGKMQYGFLWNMPNYGGADFSAVDTTTWTAHHAYQADYWVGTFAAPGRHATASSATGRPAALVDGTHRPAADVAAQPGQPVGDILRSYVDVVGHAPVLPRSAAGYWHSMNRFASQEQLLEVARELHNRSIPVDVIVIDYHHWVHMGDWSFDPQAWPDVPAMVDEVAGYGMRVMVSVWPFTAVGSSSFANVTAHGLAVVDAGGKTAAWWDDGVCNDNCTLMDQSQADTRAYFWSRVEEGYFQSNNISLYWLDAAEPEVSSPESKAAAMSASYAAGSMQQVGMMFPYWHTMSLHDGLRGAGLADGEVVMLARSAWAGTQKFAAVLWSGDTHSDFQTLKISVQAGLNVQLSGIPWWTTDIGGYSGGNPSDPTFRELVVRWFQFGATCPIFRQHGKRDTAPWGYGNESYAAIVKVIDWRDAHRDYVMQQMATVAATGMPVNRPLWVDFPNDARAWGVTDQYMFGDQYLVAPVTDLGARTWTLYLPTAAAGAATAAAAATTTWTHEFTNETYAGGQTVTVDAPLDEFPLFRRGE